MKHDLKNIHQWCIYQYTNLYLGQYDKIITFNIVGTAVLYSCYTCYIAYKG